MYGFRVRVSLDTITSEYVVCPIPYPPARTVACGQVMHPDFGLVRNAWHRDHMAG
jgi:hypothetical protein